jgi:hypothetical protein
MITKATGPRLCEALHVKRAATVSVRARDLAQRRRRLYQRLAAVRVAVRLEEAHPAQAATVPPARANPDAAHLVRSFSGTDDASRTPFKE